MPNEVFVDHHLLVVVELVVAWWIGTQVVRSSWFHAGLLAAAPVVAVQLLWWQHERTDRTSLDLPPYAAAGLAAATAYRASRTVLTVGHVVCFGALAAHAQWLEARRDAPTQHEALLLAVTTLWAAREFQQRSRLAALAMAPLVATALWRVYADTDMQEHHAALLRRVGVVGEWDHAQLRGHATAWLREQMQNRTTFRLAARRVASTPPIE